MALLLASCGSTDLGSIFGGSQPQTSSSTATGDIYGTVNSVDTRNQRIDLTVDDYNNTRNMTVYYDSRTSVTYQNQTGNPSQLERGDRVSIRMANNGNGQSIAQTINVTQSVSDSSGSSYPNGSNPNTTTANGRVTGTVAYVDTSARRIDVTSSYVSGLRPSSGNNTFTIIYDSRTRVLFQGRAYQPEDLERGDQIDVTTYNGGNGQYVADTITVTRNVRN